MKKLCLIPAPTLVSCAMAVVPEPTGGSRADGMVEFSYTYNMLVRPEIDWNAVGEVATSRCKAWGYFGAEPFSGQQRVCSDDLCSNYIIKRSYQCTD